MIKFNTDLVVVRHTGAGEERFEFKGVVTEDSIHLPVDADIEVGDVVERLLPNKKVKQYEISDVEVFQSPFGGRLDHTKASFKSAPEVMPTRGGDTFNVNATNVQLATGHRSQQSMDIGQTGDQLVLVMQGIVELLTTTGLVSADDRDLDVVHQAAVEEVASGSGSSASVRRFYDWVISCAKKGGSTAMTAAITAAAGGLLQDAETLTRRLAGGD